MKLVQIIRFVVLMNFWVILFLRGGNGSFLDVKFHKTLAGGLYLAYQEDYGGVRSIEECAILCTEERELDRHCRAFRYINPGSTCLLYTKGNNRMAFPGAEIYPIEAKDEFHIVRLRGVWYAIYVSDVKKTFVQARAHCEKLGAYLLELDSVDEYEVIRKVVNYDYELHWVGANDVETEGEWVTDREGLPLDLDKWIWESGQPDDFGAQDCAVVTKSVIRDWSCIKHVKFICEKDLP